MAKKKRRRQESTSFSQHWWAFLSIAVLTGVAFWPGMHNEFVYDDVGNFIQNPNFRGLGWENIKWAFTTFYTGPYQPLSWISLSIDFQIWGENPKFPGGLDPFGYRLTSLFLHAANGIVFYLLTHLILSHFGPEERTSDLRLACLIAALLFAIHPLRVESVTWATERRDVLSGLFFIFCIYSYFKANIAGNKRAKWFGIAIAAFVLSLLSKAWGITLPVVLLILDVFPLKRVNLQNWREKKGVFLEKIPFFAISAIFAVLAIIGQRQYAMGLVADHSLVDRIMQSFYGLGFYTGKSIIPYPLSPLYQLPLDFNPFHPRYLIPVLLVIAAIVAMVVKRGRLPGLLAGCLVFAVIVSPVLGIAQSGYQIAADRYTYLACLPFPIFLAYILCRLRSPQHWGYIVSCVVVVAFVGLTMNQTLIWKDHGTMWNHVLKVESWNYQALNGRGAHLDALSQQAVSKGEVAKGKELEDSALADFNKTIELNPDFVTPYTNRAGIYIRRGKLDLALADCDKAIALKERAVKAHHYRGFLMQSKSNWVESEASYGKAIELHPTHFEALHNRGIVRRELGDLTGSLEDLSRHLKIKPRNHSAYYHRAVTYAKLGQMEDSRRGFERVLELVPATHPDINIRNFRLYALDMISKQQVEQQDWAGALKNIEAALQLAPGNAALLKRQAVVKQQLQ